MSDTTPRPDETPGDPTAPAQPADVEVTEVVPTTQDAEPATPPPPPPPPAAQAFPPPPAEQPYPQPAYAPPSYAQQQLPPPAYAAPRHGRGGPNPMSPTDERTRGIAAHGGRPRRHRSCPAASWASCAPWSSTWSTRTAARSCATTRRTRSTCRSSPASVMLISLPLMIVAHRLPRCSPSAWLFVVIVHVIGAVKANNGEWWNPPMTPQFVK